MDEGMAATAGVMEERKGFRPGKRVLGFIADNYTDLKSIVFSSRGRRRLQLRCDCKRQL